MATNIWADTRGFMAPGVLGVVATNSVAECTDHVHDVWFVAFYCHCTAVKWDDGEWDLSPCHEHTTNGHMEAEK